MKDPVPPMPPSLGPDAAPTEEVTSPSTPWWRNWKVMLPVWLAIGALIWLGLRYHVNGGVIAGGVFLVGLVSNAFAWLLGIVSLVPVIGPLIVKVLTVGFIWLLNAVGYLVSYIAIRRGFSRDVLTYRGLTVALIVGIVIGYVMGKLI
jgi:hypothetical protein